MGRLSNYSGGFAHGLSVRGLPILNTYGGKVFWVDKNGGGGSRGTFDRPFLSIDEAVGSCVADRGDIIMVKPGHVETIIADGTLTLDVAGVSIIGLGTGAKQAKIEWTTATAATVNVTAANVTIANMWFSQNFHAVVSAFTVAAGGDAFTIMGCRWTDVSAAVHLLSGVTLAVGANDFKFINNHVRFYTAGHVNSLVLTVGESIDMHVEQNIIVMPGVTAIFDLDATALTGSPIFRNNVMANIDATTGLCVAINAATVATFVDERYKSKSNVVPAADLTASFMINCHGVDVAATSSIVWPATATAWS